MAKNRFMLALSGELRHSDAKQTRARLAAAKADLARARAQLNIARRNEDAGRLASAVKSASTKASKPTESPKALVSVVEAVRKPRTQNRVGSGKKAPTAKKGMATPKRQKPAASAHVAVPRNGVTVNGVWFADVVEGVKGPSRFILRAKQDAGVFNPPVVVVKPVRYGPKAPTKGDVPASLNAWCTIKYTSSKVSASCGTTSDRQVG